MIDNDKRATAKEKLKRVINAVFVHNFAYKAFAVVAGVIIWLLATGL